MSPLSPIFLVLLLGASVAMGAADDDPRVLITSRNIFDPTRRPDRPPEAEALLPPPAPPARESLILTGSLVYPHKKVAFFSGSDPSYNAVCTGSDAIGEFSIHEITTAHVVLMQGEKRLVLPVGHQLVRIGDAPWSIATRTPSVPTPSSVPAPTTSAAAPEQSGEMSDVMKRLMERRRQELSP